MDARYEAAKEQRLRELVREYERDGYRVILQPERAARPTFLANFAPGLLAFRDESRLSPMYNSARILLRREYLRSHERARSALYTASGQRA